MSTIFTPLEELNRDLNALLVDACEKTVRDVQTKLTLDVYSGCVKRTPVDEGRARAGWQVGVNANPLPKDTGQADVTFGELYTRVLTELSKLNSYSVCYIVNDVPYILVLDQGLFDPKDPATDEDSLRRRASSRSEKDRKRAEAAFGDPGQTFVAKGFSKQAPNGMVDVTLASVRESFV